jgi:hypothetical protein
MAIWGEDGTPKEHAALDSGSARFHDGTRSQMWIVEPANPSDMAALAAEDDAMCEALATSGTASRARIATGAANPSAVAEHRKRRSQRRNTRCPRF